MQTVFDFHENKDIELPDDLATVWLWLEEAGVQICMKEMEEPDAGNDGKARTYTYAVLSIGYYQELILQQAIERETAAAEEANQKFSKWVTSVEAQP